MHKILLFGIIISKEIVFKLLTLILITFIVFCYINLDKNFRYSSTYNYQGNVVSRYAKWGSDFIQFKFGSNPSTGQENSEILSSSSKKTILLVFGSMVFSLVLSTFLIFIYYFLKNHKFISNGIIKFLNFVSSFHVLILGIIIYIIYSKITGGEIKGIALITVMIILLGIGSGNLMDLFATLREKYENILSQDYIRAAKARGESVIRHSLKEGIISIITILSSKVSIIISSTIIIERVFVYNGFCYYLLESIKDKNINLIMAITTFISIVVLAINFLSDLFQKLLDPRRI